MSASQQQTLSARCAHVYTCTTYCADVYQSRPIGAALKGLQTVFPRHLFLQRTFWDDWSSCFLHISTYSLPPPRRICFRRCLFLCLLPTLRQNFHTDLHEIFREGWQWASEEMINFGGSADHHLGTCVVFRIRHYCDIRKVVNRCKSAGHTDSPDGSTGKTCFAWGMHCSSALVFYIFLAFPIA